MHTRWMSRLFPLLLFGALPVCGCDSRNAHAALKNGGVEVDGYWFQLAPTWVRSHDNPLELVLPGGESDSQHATLRVDVLAHGDLSTEIERRVSDYSVAARPILAPLESGGAARVRMCIVEGDYSPVGVGGEELPNLKRSGWACMMAAVSTGPGDSEILFAASGPRAVVQSHRSALEATLKSAKRVR